MVTTRLGQKSERRRPSSIKLPLIDGRWMPGLELLPFHSPQIRRRRTEGGKFRIFFLDVGVHLTPMSRKKKKTKFAPFRSAPSYLRRSGRQQFAGLRHLSIRGSFDEPRTPALKFLLSGIATNTRARNGRGEFRFFKIFAFRMIPIIEVGNDAGL